jgi:hypothetical protein
VTDPAQVPVYLRVGTAGEFQVGSIAADSGRKAAWELAALLRQVADVAEREGSLQHAVSAILRSEEDMAAIERNAEGRADA